MSNMFQDFREGMAMLQAVQDTIRIASKSFTYIPAHTQPSDSYELPETTQPSEVTHGATQYATQRTALSAPSASTMHE
ncbi:hypothetical protein L915_02033, partial [Phytophthora nicotianae]